MDAKAIIDEVKGLKGTNPVIGMGRAKAALAGGTVGLICGVMVGYSKKWSLIWTGFLGAVIGGGIMMIVSPGNNSDSTT